jgi:hypothetical protein
MRQFRKMSSERSLSRRYDELAVDTELPAFGISESACLGGANPVR